MSSFVAGVGLFLLEEFWVNSENSFSVRVPWMFVCLCLEGFLGAKYKELPFGKLTWQWKLTILNMYSLLKMGIFHCYVSLLEGIS